VSAADVLALWLGERPDPQARREALRVLVAARAAGREVTLLDLRPSGSLALRELDLTEDEQRLLEALEQEGVLAREPSPAELRAALSGARSLVLLPDAVRRGRPPVLRLDPAWLQATDDATLRASIARAGQVVTG